MNSNSEIYISVDLGAGSGRVIAGIFENNKLRLEEIARFSSEAVEKDGGIFWDVDAIYKNVISGLLSAREKYGSRVISAGIDTWGVDYALIDAEGKLVSLPRSYRDPRTNGMIEESTKNIPQGSLYARTGVQSVFFNTLYQLLAEIRFTSRNLKKADSLLFMPDLLNYMLTGKIASECTIAGTSQLYDPASCSWAEDVIEKMELPRKIFCNIINPGTVIGNAFIGGHLLKIVSVCSHDTESAVVGIPFEGGNEAFISSGTWSLLGIENNKPVLTEVARNGAYSNEAGFGNTIALLCNMTGLWIVQECKRHWDDHGDHASYDCLIDEASHAPASVSFIDPDDPNFVTPGNMPERLARYYVETCQEVPDTRGKLLRSVFESMALKYKTAVENLENVSGRRIAKMRIVGGGSKNTLLNQLTANALGIPVLAGPVEATAIGNILVQMLASGSIDSIAEGREIVRSSFGIQTFLPK
jgi:rhamnulokinase